MQLNFHHAALSVILLDQISADLRANLGIGIAVESADPFAKNGDILLLNLNHLDIDRRARRCARDRVWACPEDHAEDDQAKHSDTSNYKRAF